MITPHGGELINRYAADSEKELLLEKAPRLPALELDDKNISDLEMIGCGAMSPLTGFMTEKEYRSVVREMRLTGGPVWSIPITLAVNEESAANLKQCEEAALYDHQNRLLAILQVADIYRYDREEEARQVFRTTDRKHPGVAYVYEQGDYLVGGEITMVNPPAHENFRDYRLDPADTRAVFRQKGWDTIVAFQTRNPIHRAHEYLQKCALEIVDGLLIHPLVGRTKADDISAEIRMKSYQVLLENYYPKNRYLLSVFPAAMRYAGPREAIFHALVRKNYGCTHIIIGRDHAGVGSYYGTYDAQHIFREFTREELDITPLFFEHAFYCTRTQSMATTKTSPSKPEERIFLSGTKVRELLKMGEMPPPEFTRPEVARLLMETMKENGE